MFGGAAGREGAVFLGRLGGGAAGGAADGGGGGGGAVGFVWIKRK